MVFLLKAVLLTLWSLLLLSIQTTAQTTPIRSLPFESVGSEDPAVTSTLASAALCSLQSIVGTDSSARGIGPLIPQTACLETTASVIGQTLPSSGVATIFQSSSSGSQTVSIASAEPTTAPLVSPSTTSSSVSSSSAPASTSQPNSGRSSRRPPPGSGWVANQNIVFLLLTTFALLAGVTYFLDELLSMLV